MENLIDCPVCSGKKITAIGTYSCSVLNPPPNIQQGGLNVLLKHVVFLDSCVIKTLLCHTCRHIFLSPTFEEDELNRLYTAEITIATKMQYRVSERVSGKSWAEQNSVSPLLHNRQLEDSNEYRSLRLLELVEKATGRYRESFLRVCDIGGQSGELTSKFVSAQRYVYDKDCSNLVDEGVLLLKSMEEVIQKAPYDLLILSHILEHIPFPVKFLTPLSELLAPEGIIYTEVPLEYCGSFIKRRGIPLSPHVNYFTRRSLLTCLGRSGFKGIKLARREVAPYGQLRVPVIKVIAGQNTSIHSSYSRAYFPWFIEVLSDIFFVFIARYLQNRVTRE